MMMTFIDQLREIKPVPLNKKKAIKFPLMAAEISSKVQDVGYQEAEYFDVTVKLGVHSELRFPNESDTKRADMLRNTQKAIADLVYRDIHYGLRQLLSDVYRVDDFELRQSMETTISDIFAKTEIG